jgi:hypothetical protein
MNCSSFLFIRILLLARTSIYFIKLHACLMVNILCAFALRETVRVKEEVKCKVKLGWFGLVGWEKSCV